MQETEMEFVHCAGGKVHPKSDGLGRGRVVVMFKGSPITPIKYKSRERALNDLRNRGLIA